MDGGDFGEAVTAVEPIQFDYEYEFVDLDSIFLAAYLQTCVRQSFGYPFCSASGGQYIVYYRHMEDSVLCLSGSNVGIAVDKFVGPIFLHYLNGLQIVSAVG